MVYQFIEWVFPLASLLFVFFERSNRKKMIYIIGLGLAVFIVRVMKGIFDVPRPDDALVLLNSGRFPSTHAAISFYPLGYFLKEDKRYLVALMALFAVIGAYSRIFLKVHLMVDVLVGGLIGMCVGMFVVYLMEKRKISTS